MPPVSVRPRPSRPALLARVIAPEGPAADALCRTLQRLGARVLRDVPSPDPLPTEGDVLFVPYAADLARRIPSTPGLPRLALVVLLEPGQAADPEVLRHAGCHAILPYPAPPELVAATLAVARDIFLYEARLRSRIDKLEETLRALRTIERAKALLMHERNMTEDQAYALLRERAMAQRVAIGAVAAAVLDKHELLKTL